MKLSNKLKSGEGKLTADMSYLEQTSQLKQNLRNKAVPDLTTKSISDVGVSDLQVGGDYGGVSHGLMTIMGNAALGALSGAMGGIGGAGAPLQAYGMPGAGMMGAGMMGPGMMGPGMMGTSMMPHPGMGARMAPPPRGYMAQPPRRM
ncbi:conserved hypothetical protein [Theileria orientalis strain Shintoku]|uniref:Uncharacterized protein n=1 Tax=Theileria orientalis strain Shintoku TaxID=869250 RepID=J4C3R1_THEOR|nr:conserved hypothetical protein [Theileria orientalis strain Shintoku]BAM40881.1 conserved hypothetical protein [Theileria orientalis strain Shintoku]|eukprot:XP_009691182.1 conserved hypothetical protein [Theileria orientalis strain Shintoku]